MELKVEAAETFGTWLKKRRRAMDLTQEALADCAGCSLVTIRKFESDERRPSRQLAEQMARCLAIPEAEREAFVAFARQPEGVSSPAPALADLSPTPLPGLDASPVASRPVVLPVPLTTLIGREAEIEMIGDLLLRSSARLITLTGPGGTGKTRLAVEVARRMADEHPDTLPNGVFFVDLSSLSEPALFRPALIEALGIIDTAGEPLAAIKAHLRPKQLLLVLDNFEQIVDAAADLAEILIAAGGVTALVTTRSVLRVYGEQEVPVAPLDLPTPEEMLTLDMLTRYPAIALFVERSRAARPGFALSADNAAAVRGICARLDGLPLAIELAAARSKLFSPAALLSQLTNSLDLAARQRDVSERQQTMRGAIDWSYQLLSAEEQQLFRALGVFMSVFGLEEARAVMGMPAGADDYLLLDQLAGLVEKSMIRQLDSTDENRFQMLFVLREFALEQLANGGETDQYRAAHLKYFLTLAQEEGRQMILPDNVSAKERLMAANDDLRAAMSWAFEQPERAEQGIALAIALADFWKVRSMMTEGGRWVNDGLRVLRPDATELRAKALVVAARMANYEARFAESARLGRQALRLLEDMGDAADEDWVLSAYHILGNSSADLGDFDEALRYQHRLLEIHRRRQNLIGIQQMIRAIGLTSFDMGKFDEAAEVLQESITLNRQHGGWVDDLFLNLNALGVVELVRGQFSTARRLFDEALAVARQLGTPMWQAMILNNLGHLDIPMENHDEARRYFAEARQLAFEIGSHNHTFQTALGEATLALLENKPAVEVWPLVQECLEHHRELGAGSKRFLRLSDVLALFSVRAGRPDLAVQLLGKAEALREQNYSQPRFANVQPVYEQTMALVRQQLSQEEISLNAQQGRELTEASLLVLVEAAGAPHSPGATATSTPGAY